jgi:uncharacterized protein (TIGR02145 family)
MGIALIFTSVNASALNISISFLGSGASTTIDSVKVQNLTKGTSVTVQNGNVLNLMDAPNAVSQLNADMESVNIYPNPIQTSSTLTFNSAKTGMTYIMVYSPEGKKLLGFSGILEEGKNSFQLSIPAGIYNIQITGNGFRYNAKAISQSLNIISPQISMNGHSTDIQMQKAKIAESNNLVYTIGDQLLFKAYSGKNTTVVTDKPTGNKTINFEFVECKDADNNYYGTVRIGDQIWMLENLKTTNYNDGTVIPYSTDSTTWAKSVNGSYCWYNYDITNKDVYGALYNWHSVGTSKLAPTGWHVAYDEEWTEMENYLIANGYNYDGTTTGNKIAKSLASTSLWQREIRSDTTIGSIANNLFLNNSSGFSAVPGGCLYQQFDSDNQLNGGYETNWWTASAQNANEAWSRDLYDSSTGTLRYYDSFIYGKSVRCVCYTGTSPHVITTIPGSILTTTAISGGNIVYDGGSSITAKGVCWSTAPGPTISLSTKTNQGSGSGSFVSTITGLVESTTYYVRAYVSNGSTTTYGLEQQFTTPLNDYDGDYIVNGNMLDVTNANFIGAYPNKVQLESVDANSVAMFDVTINNFAHLFLNVSSLSYYGSFAPVFAFDTTNKIIAVTNYYGQPSANGRSAELDPSGINTFDPVTRTISVSYWMNQPSVIAGHRTHFVETFTYLGSWK